VHIKDDEFKFKLTFWMVGILSVLYGIGKYIGFL